MKKRFAFFIICTILVFAVLSNAFAQTVSVALSSIKFDGNYYIVKGLVKLSDLNPKGQIPESDEVQIYMDIMSKKGGKWPELPDTQWITKGYVKNGKVLTEQELNGTNCRTIQLWEWPVRQDAWKEGASEKNGTLYIDFSKIKSSYSNEFEIKIPKIYANYNVRIRIFLGHVWGGPYAAWPAFSYHHVIIYEGVLKNIAGKRNETKEEAIKNSKNKLLEILKKMPHFGTHDSQRKTKGMHIFPKPKYVNLKGKYDEKTKAKLKAQLEEFVKKNKIERKETIKGNGEKKKKIPPDNPTLKDKAKYYGGKSLGNLVVKIIPGGSLISPVVENTVIRKLGLGDVKKTQIELNVDPLSASLYNKFNSISEKEKKYSVTKKFIESIGKVISVIYENSLGRYGKKTKRKLAIAYKLEYETVVKRIKEGTPIETIKKDIENAGAIVTEYQQVNSKEFKNSNYTPSQYAYTYSKGEFKDPEKRFEFYVKLAKEKGDLE